MNNLSTEIGFRSLNKFREELCGDSVQIIKQSDDSVVAVLADGLGSGVKANILSTLTSKIISTMMAANCSVEECVETIAHTLPVCEVRKIAYSTFTIVRIEDNEEAEIYQFDNPNLIILRKGKNYDYPMTSIKTGGKVVYRSRVRIENGDVFIMMSDGCIYAGIGRELNFGWQRENIITYMEENFDANLSAKSISNMLIEKCNELYGYEPGDDTTAMTIKVRERNSINLLIGPPVNKDDDKLMLSSFFRKRGKHIVCGGTTSGLVSKFLGKEIDLECSFLDHDVPPIAKIEGVDLVTEGVITISKVLTYAKSFLSSEVCDDVWNEKNDGASLISRLLFEEATDINFYVGRAINPAHQNPDLPINFSIKMRLIDELAECLKTMGKAINVSYF